MPRSTPHLRDEPVLAAHVSSELARDVHELARATDRSVASIVRLAVKRYVYSREREHEQGAVSATPIP